MRITEIYKSLNPIQFNSEIEELIWNCFQYKIFLLRPSKEHKQWFKECYEVEYPKEDTELTKKLIKELKQTISFKKKDEKFKEKMKKQRYDKGYADVDIWNFNYWLADSIHKMMRDFNDNKHGHPLIDEEGNYLTKGNTTITPQMLGSHEKWTEILDRISFLAGELNEDTCSLSKEYNDLLDEWHKYIEDFRKEFGNGDILKTEEELEHEKKYNVHIAVFPDRHPDKQFVKEYNKKTEELRKFERNMFKYQNKCKNELFDLLKKYYWDLWD